MNIFLNKNQWNKFSDEELENYKENVFKYYRKHGFPYFPTDEQWRKNEFDKFMSFDDYTLLNNDEIGQAMHGLALCWSYMPHAYNVNCNGFKTPLEAFLDDNTFRQVIDKRIKFGDNISDNGIRKMLKIFSGVQSVSNFRPTAAGLIYKLFAKDKVVWDMSCGYGGRLLGAIKSEVKKYIGTEPCTQTFNGLQKISEDCRYNQDDYLFPLYHTKVELYKVGSEDFIPEKNSLDFCFTSPPYFNTERYSNELTQSYLKYSSKEEWIEQFLSKTLKNCYYGLNSKGILAINIANVRSYNNLENDFLNVAQKNNFDLMKIMKYSLSSLSHKDKYKYEPIFIFRKKI